MMTNPMLTILPRTWCLMSPSYNLCGILVINLCQKMIIVEYCYYKFMKVFLVAVLKAFIVFGLSILLFSNLGETIFWMIVKCMLVGVLCLIVYSRDILSVLRRTY